jgi:hypothetical protein
VKSIVRVARGAEPHWVGDGFPVRSLFSYQDEGFSPFLLLDYAAPHEFPPGEKKRGVGEHPHRGFETVTIVYQGELEHRDSAGNSGAIGPGDVQWMTAASGVVHEEFHSEAFARSGGVFEVVQLWVNLPAKDKMSPPRYQGILASRIPSVALPDGGGVARIIAGEFDSIEGPARTFTPIDVWDLRFKAGFEGALPVADGRTAILVVLQGAIAVEEGETLRSGELALHANEGEGIEMKVEAPTTALLLAGEPIREPVVGRGPFVMNFEGEIRQAMLDYQSGRMGRLD